MSPEPLDPEKFHILTPTYKMYAVILAVGLLFAAAFGLVKYYEYAVVRQPENELAVKISITSGQSIESIGKELYALKLINSEALFKIYIVSNNLQTKMQAGDYVIPPKTNLVDLIELLKKGKKDIRVTLIEGWRNEQTALELSKVLPYVSYLEFVKQSAAHQGFLFPDTYQFKATASTTEVIDILTNNFNQKVPELKESQIILGTDFTKTEIVNLAAMIEREITKEEDLQIVAGIIIKRLQEGMRLDIDATTQFSAANVRNGCAEDYCDDLDTLSPAVWWPKDLTLAELNDQNSYNTRAIVGLPKRPISNPGRRVILSVLNAQESPYYYYLSDKDGVTRYAKDLDEHNTNVAKYLN